MTTYSAFHDTSPASGADVSGLDPDLCLKVLWRIRRLQDKTTARGCTPPEAATAAAKAAELMSLYNITEAEVIRPEVVPSDLGWGDFSTLSPEMAARVDATGITEDEILDTYNKARQQAGAPLSGDLGAAVSWYEAWLREVQDHHDRAEAFRQACNARGRARRAARKAAESQAARDRENESIRRKVQPMDTNTSDFCSSSDFDNASVPTSSPEVPDTKGGREGQGVGVEAPTTSGDVSDSGVIDVGGGIDEPASPAQSPPPPIIISLGSIDSQLRPASEMREFVSEETIEEYAKAEVYAKEPIRVISETFASKYWLVDGRHRLLAAKAKGVTKVMAVVTTGTYNDARKLALGANERHGLRVTNADKRFRVRMTLADPEMSNKSNRWIAVWCGVSEGLVRNLRPTANDTQLGDVDIDDLASPIDESTAEDPQLTDDQPKTLGRDGKLRRKPQPRAGMRTPVQPPSSATSPPAEAASSPPPQADPFEAERIRDMTSTTQAVTPAAEACHEATMAMAAPQLTPETESIGRGQQILAALTTGWMTINPVIPDIDTVEKCLEIYTSLDDEGRDDLQFLGEQLGALSKIILTTTTTTRNLRT